MGLRETRGLQTESRHGERCTPYAHGKALEHYSHLVGALYGRSSNYWQIVGVYHGGKSVYVQSALAYGVVMVEQV